MPSNNPSRQSSHNIQNLNPNERELPTKKQRIPNEQEGDPVSSATDGASSSVALALSAHTTQPDSPLCESDYSCDSHGGPAKNIYLTEAGRRAGENLDKEKQEEEEGLEEEEEEHSNQLGPMFEELLNLLPLVTTETAPSDRRVQDNFSVHALPTIDEQDGAGHDGTEDAGQDGTEDARQRKSASSGNSSHDRGQGSSEGYQRLTEPDILRCASHYILSMQRERAQLLEENRELRNRIEDHKQQESPAGA